MGASEATGTSNDLDRYDGEIILYYGDIRREGYQAVSDLYESIGSKRKKICLALITNGGDADAAYRIARATHHHFDSVEILIADICKSAGTLLCIGAGALIFGDRGELGPLDIQLSKPDEIAERMSGLDIVQAIDALQSYFLESFREYLLDIKIGGGIRTKTAAEIAADLAEGFIGPIAARIDPMTLGEHQRAIKIAYDYGDRLNAMANSLKQGALAKLVSGYSSHGFVIDRKEASSLFKNVSAPDEKTEFIYQAVRAIVKENSYPAQKSPYVLDLKKFLADGMKQEKEEVTDEAAATDDARGEGNDESPAEAAVRKGTDVQADVDSTKKQKAGSSSKGRKRTSRPPEKPHIGPQLLSEAKVLR